MKKLILLLTLSAIIFSCSNDDENLILQEENIDPGVIRISQVDTQSDLVVLT